MSETVPFQTIQFSISTQYSSILPVDRTISGATIPRKSVDSRAMAMKGYSAFPKDTVLLGPQNQIVLYHIRRFVDGGPYRLDNC